MEQEDRTSTFVLVSAQGLSKQVISKYVFVHDSLRFIYADKCTQYTMVPSTFKFEDDTHHKETPNSVSTFILKYYF